ncbi:outer membrane protein assembly factor BamE [Paraburkholderia rhynchosiae]|uniref:Outer membrane protein assembly factor BamE n=1 Tax=Paraburkholderia rhynchosiae TaxID=487049 RepID=A0A2N7WJ60_9BURK|nr:outer membrane protein assembly factor BamE [Paraburkholderia rhynchosiae]PMS29468.1 outer membrane protein assembly factor BamE [Paraburkholderia rhynchosiae]CAB3705331.1 hypothetical protein LMG27174_03905 [Paraburkholderia rhynchosiae]
MNIRSIALSWATLSCLAGLAGLAGCVGPLGTDTAFPKADTSTWPEGSFPNSENLGKVAPGMTKTQLYELVGPPHFHESVFHVRVWNYLFHFRTADGIANCQYQVQFDDDSRVRATRWRDQACEKFSSSSSTATSESAAVPLNVEPAN